MNDGAKSRPVHIIVIIVRFNVVNRKSGHRAIAYNVIRHRIKHGQFHIFRITECSFFRYGEQHLVSWYSCLKNIAEEISEIKVGFDSLRRQHEEVYLVNVFLR